MIKELKEDKEEAFLDGEIKLKCPNKYCEADFNGSDGWFHIENIWIMPLTPPEPVSQEKIDQELAEVIEDVEEPMDPSL